MKIFITICALALSTKTFAQNELFGSWSFREQSSISGKLYSNGSPKAVKIDTNSFEKVTVGADGDMTIKDIVSLEKPTESVTASKRKKKITFKKEGNKYVEYVNIYSLQDSTKFERKQSDTWYLEDGNLVLIRKDENMVNGEVWESRTVYTKN